MTVRRLIAIGFIFVVASAAWFLLGASLVHRTGQFDGALRRQVELLWGDSHVQRAPEAWVARPRPVVATGNPDQTDSATDTGEAPRAAIEWVPATLTRSVVDVVLELEQRQKGLLWYDTYTVGFRGTYLFANPDDTERRVRLRFQFPARHAIYDDFTLLIDGQAATRGGDLTKEVDAIAVVPARGQVTMAVSYRSRGLDDWRYAFSSEGVAEARDFVLTARTNVRAIDFPPGTISPTSREAAGDGWALTWRFANLITGQAIGVDLPARQNPGPLAARITFFAPVSLLFFLAVMVVLDVLSGDALHPMNYVFISAAFFAFHLLLAYLVDLVSVHLAFAIAAVVSTGLVASYLRAVGGLRRRWWQAVAAQALFLVAFSYAFFFEGFTGLAVTLGAVLTLFVLMQMTARVRWAAVFEQGQAAAGGHHAV